MFGLLASGILWSPRFYHRMNLSLFLHLKLSHPSRFLDIGKNDAFSNVICWTKGMERRDITANDCFVKIREFHGLRHKKQHTHQAQCDKKQSLVFAFLRNVIAIANVRSKHDKLMWPGKKWKCWKGCFLIKRQIKNWLLKEKLPRVSSRRKCECRTVNKERTLDNSNSFFNTEDLHRVYSWMDNNK